ncbi:aspartate ammonia-lyase [Geothrix sp. PMB-07]|uniref:aspartate ammonia-lyase n=1 Tax=Geothrix sp. PMB-07 TaxID=3068640 RepID=UPI002741167B|nr:aspartate ammonia-lyase [Geothrix sp. PMB-07]WLT31760.1 aspartate ammonia-lyase [Geothrix sp. PMB-07]
MDAITTVLRRCEIFSGLSDTDLSLIARTAKQREVPAGTVLFNQGEPRLGTTVIVEGRVEISRDNGDGPEPVVILGPGDVAGEQSFLAVSTHTASGKALTAAVLIDLDREAVLQSLSTDGAAAIAVLSKVANVMHQRLLYSATPRTGREQAYASGRTRKESDLLGTLEVPEDALFGVQTLRAVHNFPITGTPTAHFPAMIRALAMVKQGAARANARLGLLEPPVADAIDRACQEIIDGHWHGHFPTDMVQGGAGTSTNMNANEVIANRALELLGHNRGEYAFCHPNDHVNLGQSTNDVYPTALRLSTIFMLKSLLEAMDRLKGALHAKGREFSDVIKMGRTQLQDAVPMTLGQEFEAYAVTTGEDILRLQETARLFLEVNMGGTAIGTGICADPRYPETVVEELRKVTGLDIVLAENLVEATPDTGAFVMFSGVVKRAAVKLSKLCNDLRLLSSGPRCGFGEINLPAMQPGSSIMPGKVNPVIPEVVNQVAFSVIGNDLTITLAAEAGQLQLNVMEPILAYSLATSLKTLTAAVNVLTTKCIVGITANRERCLDLVERSIGIVTAVMPAIGYKKATEVAKEALDTGVPVRELILRKGYLTPEDLDEALSLVAMTQPRAIR